MGVIDNPIASFKGEVKFTISGTGGKSLVTVNIISRVLPAIPLPSTSENGEAVRL